MKISRFLKTFSMVFALALLLLVNYMANSLPINGLTTGEVSALYPNYFVPIGFTFSIWAIIYLFVLVFVFKVWVDGINGHEETPTKYSFWFGLSCFANAAWIYCWHHLMVELSVVVMLVLLASLLRLYHLSRGGKWWEKITFSVYLGWILVALIANITALLVQYGWDGMGIDPAIYAIALCFIAFFITLWFHYKNNDNYLPLVLIWALFGITYRHFYNPLPNSEYIVALLSAQIILLFLALLLPKPRFLSS